MAPARTYLLDLRIVFVTVILLLSFTLSLSISVDEGVTSVRQSKKILGSRPPRCVNKCVNCRPCQATLVIPPHPKMIAGAKKLMNSELWHACAGPMVSLPPVRSLVVYFPQGHNEQVAVSMQKDTHNIPSYPSLPSKLICMLHNVTLHADAETDEVYAQMTLQPVNKYDQEALLISDMGLKQNRQPSEFFCKTLTASDTSRAYQAVQFEQHWLQAENDRHAVVNEKMGKRAVHKALIESATLIGASILQVYLLQCLFERKLGSSRV